MQRRWHGNPSFPGFNIFLFLAEGVCFIKAHGKTMGFGAVTTWGPTLALPFSCCVALGKWLSLSELFVFCFVLVWFCFCFLGWPQGHMEVPRLRVNQSCSCWPPPQPQQSGIRASSATYTTTHSNPGSWTHSLIKARDGTCILMGY